jgi:hypothetical protein
LVTCDEPQILRLRVRAIRRECESQNRRSGRFAQDDNSYDKRILSGGKPIAAAEGASEGQIAATGSEEHSPCAAHCESHLALCTLILLPDQRVDFTLASTRAEVAELADAHGSGPCTRKGVGVRVPSSAPILIDIQITRCRGRANSPRPSHQNCRLPSSHLPTA